MRSMNWKRNRKRWLWSMKKPAKYINTIQRPWWINTEHIHHGLNDGIWPNAWGRRHSHRNAISSKPGRWPMLCCRVVWWSTHLWNLNNINYVILQINYRWIYTECITELWCTECITELLCTECIHRRWYKYMLQVLNNSRKLRCRLFISLYLYIRSKFTITFQFSIQKRKK